MRNKLNRDLLEEKKVYKTLIDICIEFGNEKKGSFFIVTKSNIKKYYKQIFPNLFEGKKFNIFQKNVLPLVKKLAEMDGAIVLDEDGNLIANGVQVKISKPLPGHGTRHSSALGISQLKGVTSITSSEEDGCVRVFLNGRLLIEINPLTKAPKTLSDRIADLITSAQLPIGGGIASIALGVNPLVAAIAFTGSYIVTKGGIQSISEFIKSGFKWKKEEKK
jgi:hypothetical protein